MSYLASFAPRQMWSRMLHVVSIATVLSLVFGGLLLVAPQSTSAQSAAVVTDYLNLRSGASTDSPIILVMSPGSAVSLDGGAENGFLSLTYNGTWGWAHADWIATGGSAPVDDTGVTGNATVIDGALNLRSGPSTSNSVITVMPDGAVVSLTGEAAGGFLGVVYNGTSGWAYADYLSTGSAPAPDQPAPNPGTGNPGVGDVVVGTMTTTDYLNLRGGPSTGNVIITTIPSGTSVEIMGDPQGAWYPVRYAGNKGWAHGDWLTGSSTPAPDPAPPAPAPTPTPTPKPSEPAPSNPVAIGDTIVGERNTTTGLNLREGPGTNYAVILVMPGATTVSVMGEPVNGFYPLTFHGTKGWASGDYLTTSAVPQPSPPGDGSQKTYTRDEIVQIIYAAADKYGQPRADMLRVAQCESVLNPSLVNPTSGASGLFQFMPGTWQITPFKDHDIFDPVASAEATGWMWQNGMRNHWVCQ